MFLFFRISLGSADSLFYTTYLGGGNQLRLQSAKVETCFLLFNNSEFVGGVPTYDNEVFEKVDLGFHMIALRVVNTQQGGSGASETSETPDVNTEVTNTAEVQAEETQTEESPDSECYLGFDRMTGKPECYDSVDSRAAKFILIDL